jgi:hypothetical protein
MAKFLDPIRYIYLLSCDNLNTTHLPIPVILLATSEGMHNVFMVVRFTSIYGLMVIRDHKKGQRSNTHPFLCYLDTDVTQQISHTEKGLK